MKEFKRAVYEYYARHKRRLPWRDTCDPYHIIVSEVMLQQTQVARVTEKYKLFVQTFPDIKTLAAAPLPKVLAVWQGLGYNRRALLLKKLAQTIIEKHHGKIPAQREILQTLPGIGKATSGSICAFAFNQPVVFIETNIRSVFIHHFFKDSRDISDHEILPLVHKTLDRKNPGRWYSALMDYGVHLKETLPNPSRRSKHYTRQSRFQGSDRQIRGAILRLLLIRKRLAERTVCARCGIRGARADRIIAGLAKDGLIFCRRTTLELVD